MRPKKHAKSKRSAVSPAAVGKLEAPAVVVPQLDVPLPVAEALPAPVLAAPAAEPETVPVEATPKKEAVEAPKKEAVEAPKIEAVEAPKKEAVEAPKSKTVEQPFQASMGIATDDGRREGGGGGLRDRLRGGDRDRGGRPGMDREAEWERGRVNPPPTTGGGGDWRREGDHDRRDGRVDRTSPVIRAPVVLPQPTSVASAWTVKQREQKESGDKLDQVTRAARSILNKITLEKFDRLYGQLQELGITTQAELEALMKMVFEKATTQHHFSEMYAGLCARLWKDLPSPTPSSPTATIAGAEGEKEEKTKDFKRILLEQCQASFESYLKPHNLEKIADKKSDAYLEAFFKYKTSMTGTVKFVGQLLIRKMIAASIIGSCIDELIGGEEEQLETLCAFLTTIGPAYAPGGPSGASGGKRAAILVKIADTFKRLSVIAEDKDISARIRCLIKDVLDLRDNNWRTTQAHKQTGPMKIADVHAEARADELRKARESEANRYQGGGRRDDYGHRNRQPVVNHQPVNFSLSFPGDDSWTAVMKKGTGRGPAAAFSMPIVTWGIYLGPQNFKPQAALLSGGFAALASTTDKRPKKVEKDTPLDKRTDGTEDEPRTNGVASPP